MICKWCEKHCVNLEQLWIKFEAIQVFKWCFNRIAYIPSSIRSDLHKMFVINNRFLCNMCKRLRIFHFTLLWVHFSEIHYRSPYFPHPFNLFSITLFDFWTSWQCNYIRFCYSIFHSCVCCFHVKLRGQFYQ